MTGSPLAGVRVLDLSQRLPGGYCTMLLADHGAEVIKVEPPSGDFTRSVPPNVGEDGAVHWILNRNKKSVTLDLKTAGGREHLLGLAATADVVVEGSRPGVARRLGADYETLRRIRPSLVYCSITGYGQDGPHRDDPGHDVNYMAVTGVLGLSAGGGDEAPSLPPVPIADLAAGSLMATSAILLALRERDRSGRGQYIDVSMTDGLLALLPLALADVAAGEPPPSRGELVIAGAYPCYGVYRTADGRWLTLGLLEPEMWGRLCRRLEREEWIERQFDPAAAASIREHLIGLIAERPWEHWRLLLAELDVAAAPVLSLAEALASDHVAARGPLTTMPDRDGEPRLQLRSPLRLSGTPGTLRRPAPRLGEHNEEILGVAGDTPADLIVTGGHVVTMDGARRIVPDGMVVIRDGTIVAVGPRSELEGRHRAAKVIDAGDALVTPGLIDAHNHPIHFLSKGIADDLELSERSYRRVWPYELALSDEEAQLSSLGTFAEMIRNGTTCFCDPGSFRPDAVAAAARDIGIRGVVSREAWDVPDANAPTGTLETAEEAVERGTEFVQRWNGAAGDRLRAWLSLVRPSHVTDELCRRTRERADALGVGIHAHMTISRTTNQDTRRVVGPGSAVRRFHELGLLEPNLCLAHLGWVEPPEIELLLAGDVKAVHCPSASMLGAFGVIAHGTFPEMLDAGLTVGLGSDACAISRFIDLVRVVYIAACAHKDVRMDATVMGAHRAFEMATRDGARVLLWEDRIGSLEPGKAADLVVFDTDELEWHPNPLRNPVANLVYSASGRSARTVVIDGEVVMQDRVLARVDLDELRAAAAAASDRVLARIGVTLVPPWPLEVSP